MNALETTLGEEGLSEGWALNLDEEWVEGLEWSSSFQIYEDEMEEEELTYSMKLEGRTRATSVYEDIDFYPLEERCLTFVS